MSAKTRWIPAANVPGLEKKIATLARKAKKYGCEPPTVKRTGRTEIRRVEFPDETVGFVLFEEVEISGGEPVRIEGGWRLLGVLDHPRGEERAIVRTVPGESVPSEFWSSGGVCEHCRRALFRSRTYILRAEDDRVIQVGSTCVKDFLGGKSAAAVVASFSIIRQMETEEDRAERVSPGMPFHVPAKDFFAAAIFLIRTEGWVSKRRAAEAADGSLVSTATLAWDGLFDPHLGVKPTEDDDRHAEAALEWMKTVETGKADLDWNLQTIAERGYVSHNDAGFAAFGAKLYFDEFLREKSDGDTAEWKNAPLAAEKERVEVDVTVVSKHQYEAFGYRGVELRCAVVMRDSENRRIVWFTSAQSAYPLEVGERYRVKVTVAGFDADDKRGPTTRVARVKIVSALSAAA